MIAVNLGNDLDKRLADKSATISNKGFDLIQHSVIFHAVYLHESMSLAMLHIANGNHNR